MELTVLHSPNDVDEGCSVEYQGSSLARSPQKITVPNVPLKNTHLCLTSAILTYKIESVSLPPTNCILSVTQDIRYDGWFDVHQRT